VAKTRVGTELLMTGSYTAAMIASRRTSTM
jgi:hypothetical protein